MIKPDITIVVLDDVLATDIEKEEFAESIDQIQYTLDFLFDRGFDVKASGVRFAVKKNDEYETYCISRITYENVCGTLIDDILVLHVHVQRVEY